MIKGFFSFLLFIFLLLVLILMLTGSYLLRTVRKMKKAAEQMAEQQARQHREETARQRQQYGHRATSQSEYQQGQSDYRQTQQQEETRYTQTASGATIIDRHHQERENKKIFDDSEGEYVEYEEA